MLRGGVGVGGGDGREGRWLSDPGNRLENTVHTREL